MNSIQDENFGTNAFQYKIVDIYPKINSNDLCWFCNAKCSTFVRICKNCKYERYEKKKKLVV